MTEYTEYKERILKRSKIVLLLCLTAIVLAAAITAGLNFYLKLDEPVFFKNYQDCEIQIDEENGSQKIQFVITYLANRGADSQVVDIRFPERPDLKATVRNYNPEDGGFEGEEDFIWGTYVEGVYRYELRGVGVTIPVSEGTMLNEAELSEATVRFRNGETQEIDLGKLCFYQGVYDENPLSFVESGSSSDGTSCTKLIAEGDLTLQRLESPLLAIMGSNYELKVNGAEVALTGSEHISLNSIPLKAGETVTIESAFHPQSAAAEVFCIDIRPKLVFSDQKGIEYSRRIYNMDNRLSDSSQIMRYLREEGIK